MKAFSCLVQPDRAFAVAVSGGSDSLALLMLAADYRAATGAQFAALTVDHGLRPEAKHEVRFVSDVCAQLGVEHHALRWRRAGEGPVAQEEARIARHTLMANRARRLGIDSIAVGHTRDDRLETFLMRARQGSGWHGLAGPMPNSVSPARIDGGSLRLIRPLLAFGREELRDELRARGMTWIDDPSNDTERFERVRMRKLLARMDAGARKKALTVMNRLTRLRASVMTEAGSLVARLQASGPDASNPGPEMGIPLGARDAVGEEAWLRFVEAMVMTAGGADRAPRRAALDRLLARVAAHDASLTRGVTLAGAKIRIRKDAILSFGRAPPRRESAPARSADRPDWSRAAALLETPDLRVLEV